MTRIDIWMPLTWGDYARDTGHLNATMHGAYLMLIKHYWCSGEPLPDDDALLWRIACCDSPAQWKKVRQVIARFFDVGDGVWRHKRIEAEMADATERVQNAHARGVAGANARWKRKAKTKDASSNAKSQAHTSVSKETGAGEPDAASVIFNQGLTWLIKSTGKPEGACRSLLGKWRKEVSDEKLIAALGRGQREAPIDAVAWMEKAIKFEAKQGSIASTVGAQPTADDWRGRVKWHRDKGMWNPNWGPEPGKPGCFVPREFLQ